MTIALVIGPVIVSQETGPMLLGITNPNPKVRKSGAVGKAALAQDPGFDGTKPGFC